MGSTQPTSSCSNSTSTKTGSLGMGICIRNFSIEYLDSLHDCNRAIFPVKYSSKFYRDIADNNVGCKIVLKENHVIANISYRIDPMNNSMYLMTFGCLSEYRRLGIGSLLMQSIDEELFLWKHLKSVSLHVQCNNRVALKFYTKFEFFIQRIEKNYYSSIDPPDAFFLVKYNPNFVIYSKLTMEHETQTLSFITKSFVEYIDKFPQAIEDMSQYRCTIDNLDIEILKAGSQSQIVI